jgi:hypothetical protein
VRIASASAFWICFLMSRVASGFMTLYSTSCFESRMLNLSEPTLTRTRATLNTELVSFDDVRVTVA